MSGLEDRLSQDEDAPRRGRGRPVRATPRDVADEIASEERGFDEREMTEDRDMTEDERLEFFTDSLDQSVLPDLPPMPGYHLIWLSTSNQRDSIAYRKRLGYELITMDMIPAWAGGGLDTGGQDNLVRINEMVAARLPLRLYNAYMKEVHHRKPLSEEEKLKSAVDSIKNQAEQAGTRVELGDGTAEIVQRARPMPDFAA